LACVSAFWVEKEVLSFIKKMISQRFQLTFWAWLTQPTAGLELTETTKELWGELLIESKK
jgi:hypothetical protein